MKDIALDAGILVAAAAFIAWTALAVVGLLVAGVGSLTASLRAAPAQSAETGAAASRWASDRPVLFDQDAADGLVLSPAIGD